MEGIIINKIEKDTSISFGIEERPIKSHSSRFNKTPELYTTSNSPNFRRSKKFD